MTTGCRQNRACSQDSGGCWNKRMKSEYGADRMCVATEEGKKQMARRRAEKVTGKVWCAMEGWRCTVAFLEYRLGGSHWLCKFHCCNRVWQRLICGQVAIWGRKPQGFWAQVCWKLMLGHLYSPVRGTGCQKSQTGSLRVTGDHQLHWGATELCASHICLCLWTLFWKKEKYSTWKRPWGHLCKTQSPFRSRNFELSRRFFDPVCLESWRTGHHWKMKWQLYFQPCVLLLIEE